MLNFLHTYQPESILLQFGPFTIYYYGLFIVLGIILGSVVAIQLAKRVGFPKDELLDSAFWAIVFGIIGARLYHVGLELPYYLQNPIQIFYIWQGGIAIHGGIIGGALALYYYTRKHNLNLLKLLALYAPALSLAQAIGRWGNYFNQEIYGYPTDKPWSIPIELSRRLPEFSTYEFFHPTFLYESIGNLLIFIILIIIFFILNKKDKEPFVSIIATYLISYSLLRFTTEFFRIDPTPAVLGLRLPQIASLIIIIGTTIWLIALKIKKLNNSLDIRH